MNEFLTIIINVFDIIISFFYSTYRIIVKYWGGMLVWVLLIVLFFVLRRVFRATRARTSFLKAVREAAEEAGATLTVIRSPLISLLFNPEGFDILLSHSGVSYKIKFFPGSVEGRAVHMETPHSATKQLRIFSSLALNRGKVRGKKKTLRYEIDRDEGTLNILVFAPRPYVITTRSKSGAVWEFGFDGADSLDGVYLFPSDLLAKQLVRVMEGYIDTPIGRRQ